MRSLFSLFALLAAGCVQPAAAPVAAPGALAAVSDDPAEVLGSVNGAPIRRQDLGAGDVAAMRDAENDHLQRQLAMLYGSVETAIDDRLIAAEAKKQGMSEENFRQREIADRLTPPTDDQIRVFYDLNADQIPVPFETAAPILREQMEARAREELEKALVSRLREGADVRLNIPAPRLPRYPIELGDAPVKGPTDAKVTLIEFSDFECPFCARARETIDQLAELYPNDLRIAYRDFPLAQHPRARPAAEAAQCAHEQEKFWPFHDRLFENPQDLADEDFKRYASELSMDLGAFETCLTSDRVRAVVEAHEAAGRKYGVEGTPAIFVNGIKLVGLLPLPLMQAIIDGELGQ